MNRDQADGALALDRTQSFNDRAHWQTESAIARHFNRNKIAIDGAQGAIGRDRHLAPELFLVDRHQPSAAAGQPAKNAEHAMLGAVQKLYDARGGFLFAAFLDTQQRAVADAGDFARARAARDDDADDRRRAMGGLVPFGRPRQKLAVGIAAGDVGQHHRRQGARIVQPFAQTIDLARVGKLAQHAIERGAVGVLGAKRARDLARANLAAALTDKGDKLLAGGQAGVFHLKFFGPLIGLIRRPISATSTNYSAASVGGLRAPGRLPAPAPAPGFFDDALTTRAVPGDGRLDLRGRACGAEPVRSARASIKATASSSVTVSGVLSAGRVALTPLWLT